VEVVESGTPDRFRTRTRGFHLIDARPVWAVWAVPCPADGEST